MNLSRSVATRHAGADVLANTAAVGAVLALCWAGRLVLITLLVAVMLAFLLEPIAAGLQRLRLPSPVASFLAVAVLLGSLYGASVLAYGKAAQFANDLPQYSERIRQSVRSVRHRVQRVTEAVGGGGEKAPASAGASEGASAMLSSVGPATEVVLAASFVPFLVYFMLSWRTHVHRGLVRLFPAADRPKAHDTLGSIAGIIRAFLVGNAIVGAVLGVASGVAFAVLGVPDFLFIGPLSGFLSVIPYLGVFLAALPPLLAAAATLSGGKLLAIAAVVLALHLVALNVLYPKLVGHRLSVNPLAVTIALLFWGWLWGGFGLILAVPLTAAMKAVFDHVEGLRGWGALLGDEELRPS